MQNKYHVEENVSHGLRIVRDTAFQLSQVSLVVLQNVGNLEEFTVLHSFAY